MPGPVAATNGFSAASFGNNPDALPNFFALLTNGTPSNGTTGASLGAGVHPNDVSTYNSMLSKGGSGFQFPTAAGGAASTMPTVLGTEQYNMQYTPGGGVAGYSTRPWTSASVPAGQATPLVNSFSGTPMSLFRPTPIPSTQ